MKLWSIFLVFIFWLITFDYCSFAGVTGKISGVVKDAETGEALVGVNIMLQGRQIGAASDIDGFYYIINVDPGIYTLAASYVGYEKIIIEEIVIRSDLTSKVDFQMSMTSISTQEVTVIAKEPPIQKDLTSSRQTFSGMEIDTAPIEDLQDLLVMQAGISIVDINERADIIADSPGDGLHVRGGRENETAFMIDGVRVDNPIWGGSLYSQRSSGSTVKEISSTLGTFNAEYGGKMSGIINMNTRDAGERITAQLFFQTDNLGMESFNRNTYRGEATVRGPILKNLGFLINIQGRTTDGRLSGFEIPNWSDLNGQLPLDTPGGTETPADWKDELNGLAKLTWNVTPSLRIMGSYILSHVQRLRYKHQYKYLPSGMPWSDTKSQGLTFSLTHQFNRSTFYQAFFSRQDIGHFLGIHRVREQRLNAESNHDEDIYGFYYTGAYSNLWKDTVTTYEAGFNITSQLNNIHLVKAGANLRFMNLFHLQDHAWTSPSYEIVIGTDENGEPIKQVYEDHKSYNRIEPKEYFVYVQDKMEFDEIGMIINFGLRWERWDLPLEYMEEPDNPIETEMLPVEAKDRISPRFGISYPISERAAFHFAYGHFYQFASYISFLTGINQEGQFGDRPNLKSVGLAILNPNMKPEKSITYEAGVQASLGENLRINVTVFYRELADLLGVTWMKNAGYVYFDNVDFGNVKGIEVIFDKSFSNSIGARFNYTYSQTLISTSSPLTAAQTIGSTGIAYRTQLADWDRPHDIGLLFRYSPPKILDFSLIFRAKSGRPYSVLAQTPNTERMPWFLNLDLKIAKNIPLFSSNLNIFFKIYNIFDRNNILRVYPVTGLWDDDGDPGTPYAKDANPWRISDGRRILLGLTLRI